MLGIFKYEPIAILSNSMYPTYDRGDIVIFKKMSEEEFEDEDNEIIELVDDEGKIVKFKLLDVTEYKGEKYTLLLAAEPDDEIAEDEVLIFRLNEKEEILEPIEDEDLLQEVFDFYCAEADEESEN